MRKIFIVFLLIYCSCNSNEKTTQKNTARDTDYSFGPLKDTIPVNPGTSNVDLETFGDLKIGQHYMETIRIMGAPASKSKPIEWEADGLLHEDWDYKVKGMVINLSAERMNADKTKAIFSITAKAPCTVTTTKKIGIGSSYAEVMSAYKGHIDQSMTDQTVIVAGSVYGGLIFSFKGDKVETIFVGAIAE